MEKVALTESQRLELKRRIDELGERRTAEALKVGKNTVARALAGLPMRYAVAHLLATALTVVGSPEESSGATAGT